MGQAKQRGTFEQRKAEAVVRRRADEIALQRQREADRRELDRKRADRDRMTAAPLPLARRIAASPSRHLRMMALSLALGAVASADRGHR
jgi:hypothetical protein